jgi:hypothetical protein
MNNSEEDKIIFKFNSGLGAILCSGCRTILKIGQEFTEEELSSMRGETELLSARYCDTCQATRFMKGRLHKMLERGWVITCVQEMEDSPGVLETISFPLHPDDAYELFELEQRFDFLEGRIAANPNVEFEIVEEWKISGMVKYAKLKNHDKTN